MLLTSIAIIVIFEYTKQINADLNCKHYKVVNTQYGSVRGCMSKTLLEQRPIASFIGIPYAKPPVGKLRFEQSMPPQPWNSTLDATQYKNVCNQMDAGKPIGNEDCLHINVFTPDTTFTRRLPVIFFIFGGGFYSGSGNFYGPELLLDHDVILVTFNYRLGPFGFLSLGNRDYSGNLALKDQLLALKWVRDNIHSFGGDKDKVTIYGWSAGCRSVSLHMASAASRGLFNRAICFSASALVPWILSDVKDHRERATDFAIRNGFHPSNDQQLIDYLKSVDADKLSTLTINNLMTAGKSERKFSLPWGPVVESATSKNPFLIESPVNYFKKENFGQISIDTLFGYVDAESYAAISAQIENPSLLKPFDKEFRFPLPLFGLNYSFSDPDSRHLSYEIRQFYFGNESITTQVPQFSSMTNDLMSYPVHRAIKLQSKVSCGRTFYCIFSVDLMLSRFKRMSNARAHGLTGNSTHGDDIFYVFKIKNWNEAIAPGTYESLSLESKEVSVIKTMTGIISNFATSGRPTLRGSPMDWKEVDNNQRDVNYVTITEDGLRADPTLQVAILNYTQNYAAEYVDYSMVPSNISGGYDVNLNVKRSNVKPIVKLGIYFDNVEYMNKTINVCKVAHSRKEEPLLRLIVKVLTDHNKAHIPNECPVKKGKYYNFMSRIETDKIPPVWPETKVTFYIDVFSKESERLVPVLSQIIHCRFHKKRQIA